MTAKNPNLCLPLENGDQIVLIDMLAQSGTADDVNRNVARTAATGEIIWTIGTDAGPGDRHPYTTIGFDHDGRLKAYSWSGAEYEVDLETGAISHGVLVR